MYLAVVAHYELYTTGIRYAHPHACVLHGAAKARGFAGCYRLVVVGLYCLKGLHKAGGLVHYLSVGQHLAGAYGVAVAYLPRSYAYLVRHHVEKALCSKTGLSNAEAAERSGRRIVGVIGSALYLEVLVIVGACCMGACPFKHRAAQRREGAGICIHLCFYALYYAVFVAAHGKVHLKMMSLWVYEQ